MLKNNLKDFMTLNKLHKQEKQFKRELSKTFLEYLDNLPWNKRIEQMESLLYEAERRNLPTLDRRLSFQERKCLHLASQGKEIKETANILGLSERTIKYHRANIIKKLDVPNLMATIGTRSRYCNTNKDDFYNDFYETILNIMDCNVYWKNKDGQYLWCNKKMAKIYGLKNVSNIIGKRDYDLYSPKLANPVVNLDKAILKAGEGRQVEEVGLDSENRKAIYLSIKVPTKDVFGNFNGLIGLSIDMPDVKRV